MLEKVKSSTDGKKTKLAVVLMGVGGVGMILDGQVAEGLKLLVAALAVFGVADKIERKLS